MAALSKARLLLTVFIGGVVSLALELAAARLLAPAFGTTELVWSAVIGLILLYLSAGYWLGGRWADRAPDPATLYTVLSFAGLTISVIPLAARPMLTLAAQGMKVFNLGLIAGPFIVVLVLFAAPVTLLACISPFAIRLSVNEVSRSGSAVGRFTAVSTLGSFIGTFLPNLVLIPALGTRRTFLLLALLALVTGLWGLWSVKRQRFWTLAWTVIVVAALFLRDPGTIKPHTGLLLEEESTYNLIQVIEDASGRRYLLLNEGQGIHSVYTPPEHYREDGNPLALLTGGPWDYYLIAPFFNAPPFTSQQLEQILIVGLAAGTTATQLTEVFGPIPVDGVEIDPAIVDIGRQAFEMTMPNLSVHIDDGRTFLLQTDRRYTLIAVDAYRVEIAPPSAQGALVATYSLGYRIALIISGAVALLLADQTSWANVYRIMAAFMAIPVVVCLFAAEPEVVRVRVQGWVAGLRLHGSGPRDAWKRPLPRGARVHLRRVWWPRVSSSRRAGPSPEQSGSR